MATPTYTPLATTTLSSSASSITFSSIDQSYRDLIIVGVPDTSGGGNFFMRFNGDTGNNYSRVAMAVESGSATTQLLTSQSSIRLNLSVDLSTDQTTNHIIQIMDYTATDKHTTVLARGNRGGIGRTEAIAGGYASTSAISSVTLFPSTGSFVAGTIFSMYGIAA